MQNYPKIIPFTPSCLEHWTALQSDLVCTVYLSIFVDIGVPIFCRFLQKISVEFFLVIITLEK